MSSYQEGPDQLLEQGVFRLHKHLIHEFKEEKKSCA